jgi:SAM-dependent methyltransferase
VALAALDGVGVEPKRLAKTIVVEDVGRAKHVELRGNGIKAQCVGGLAATFDRAVPKAVPTRRAFTQRRSDRPRSINTRGNQQRLTVAVQVGDALARGVPHHQGGAMSAVGGRAKCVEQQGRRDHQNDVGRSPRTVNLLAKRMTDLQTRIPEPELMNDAAQALAYANADFAAPHDAYVAGFLAFAARHGVSLAGTCLDIGCGPADIVHRLAVACPHLVIDGVDGANAMLALGRQRIESAGLSNRVRLHRCFLPHDALPRTSVDIVTSNSILHHLHEPQALWTTLRRAMRPGTAVYIMDLMRPSSKAQAQVIVDTYAAGEPEVLRDDFLASLWAAFRPHEIEEQLRQAMLPWLRVDVVSDRHVVISGVADRSDSRLASAAPAEAPR